MKKREFLAMGGAMPLMLAGCGGSTGSAPVRLVNASVGYPALGFMVQTTQATSADVAYGSASPFENVEAGSVDITLTVNNSSAAAAQLRTINKDQRYSLIAYGQVDELKLQLLPESTTTPDTGDANVNVVNTSYDIGAVDVYLSTTTSLAISSLIASSVSATSTTVGTSGFAPIVAGQYYITVVGAGSVQNGISDVRFQSSAPITLTALQIYTIILTPGISGTLANAIVLTQGTTATNPTQNLLNTTARVRAITSTNGLSTSVTAVNSTGAPVTLLAANTTPQYSNYIVVNTGTLPAVTVNGAPVTPFTLVSGVSQAATLAAGGDYTLMVYVDGSGNPLAQFITDDNTAPVTAQGVKFRLVNLASNNQGLQLSMSVNSINVASLIPFATASAYTEIATPQTTNSVAEVFNGTDLLASHNQVMQTPNIFTDFVLSVDNSGVAKDIFRSASGT